MKNNPEPMGQEKNKLQFARYLVTIASAAEAKTTARNNMQALSPTTNSKLIENNNHVKNITKKEIICLLIICYGVK
jgi:hypothetical protein